MYTLNRYLPHVLVPQSLAPAGKRAHELSAFELGIIDCETSLTIDVGTYCPDNKFELVMGSPSTGSNNQFFPDAKGYGLPIRSLPIDRLDRAHTYEIEGDGAQNFVGYLGYDGIDKCKTLSLECGQDYGLQVTVRGEAIRNVFNRNLTEIIPFTTGCCDDCSLDEQCSKTTETIMEAIEKASFYAKNYFSAAPVLSCCTPVDPFNKRPCRTFTLEVCDDGSAVALAKVAGQYPNLDVERTSRENPYSTYTVSIKGDTSYLSDDPAILDGTAWDAIVAPEDFKLTRTKVLVCEECPDCPDTFEKVEAGDSVIVCFDSPADAGVATFEEFDTDYYADQETAVDDVQALVDAAGALVPGFVADTAKLVSFDCDKATIKVCVAKDTDLKEHGVAGATITAVGECKGYCKGEAELAWCPKDNLYAIERCLQLTVKLDDCPGEGAVKAAALLIDLQKAYENQEDVLSIELDNVNECLAKFKINQCSDCVEDGCDTSGKHGAKFGPVDSYEGLHWIACECEGWTFTEEGCPVPPVEDIEDCCCGIKFEGKFLDPETLECFDDINDHIEREPIEIEVTLIRQYQDDIQCDPRDFPWTVVQYGKPAEGFGRWVLKREVLSRGYEKIPYFSPRSEYGGLLNARLGIAYGANPAKKYNGIYLFHQYSRPGQSWHSAAMGRNTETIEIYVERDNVGFMQELKDFFNKTLFSNGVCKLLK